MRGINGNVVLDGFCYTAFDVVFAVQFFDSAKNDRVVANNQVQVFTDGFIQNRISSVISKVIKIPEISSSG